VLKGRSAQLDLSAPWTAYRLLALVASGEHKTNIHLQYFSGYGESFIDYNHRHETWGLGVTFPFEWYATLAVTVPLTSRTISLWESIYIFFPSALILLNGEY